MYAPCLTVPEKFIPDPHHCSRKNLPHARCPALIQLHCTYTQSLFIHRLDTARGIHMTPSFAFWTAVVTHRGGRHKRLDLMLRGSL